MTGRSDQWSPRDSVSRTRSYSALGGDTGSTEDVLQAVRRLYRLRDFRGAFDRLRPALRSVTPEPQALALSALIQWSTGQVEDAQREAARAVAGFEQEGELDPIQQGDYGVALSILDRHDEAIEHLGATVTAHKATPEVFRHLGLSWKALDKPDLAMDALREALDRAPRDSEARKALAELEQTDDTGSAALSFVHAAQLELAERPEEALRLADLALRLEPTSARASIVRSNALRALGSLDEAVDAARDATNTDPDDFRTWFTLARAQRSSNRGSDAIESLLRANQLVPHDPEANADDRAAILSELAETSASLGDFASALQHLNEGLAMAQGDRQISELAEGSLEATKAVVLNAQGEYKKARVSAIRAISLVPKDSPEQAYAYSVLGTSLRMLGEFDDAEAHLRTALAIDRNLHWVHGDLGEALRGKGNFSEAIEQYNQYLAKVGDEPWIYTSLAASYAALGDVASAREASDRSIEVDAENRMAWELHGRIYADVDSAKALDAFERARAIDEEGFAAYDGLAEALRRAGRFGEALEAIDETLQRYGPTGWSLATRGQILLALGRSEEGIDDLLLALEQSDDVQWAHRDLGEALLQNGDAAGAAVHYAALLERYPDDESGRLGLIRSRIQVGPHPDIADEVVPLIQDLSDPMGKSVAYAELGNQLRLAGFAEEALPYLDRALALDPDAWTLGAKARAMLDLGDTDAAIAAFQEAAAYPDAPEWVHAELGEQLRLAGRHDEAIEHLNRAVELNPTYSWGFAARASAHRDMGNPGNAIADLSTAYELDPEYAWAVTERGKLNLSLGKEAEAAADLEAAASIESASAASLTDLGFELLELGRSDLAADIFDRALAKPDPTLDTHRGKSFASAGLGNHDDAESLIQAEIDKPMNESNLGVLWSDLARIRMMRKRYVGAADALLEARQQISDESWYLVNAAILLISSGEIVAARPLVERALELSDTNAHAHHLLGSIYEHLASDGSSMELLEEALARYERALELDASNDWSRIGCGSTLMMLDRKADSEGRTAQEHLVHVIDKASGGTSDTDILGAAGWAAIVSGNPDRAARLLSDAVSIDPDLLSEQFDLALAMITAGKPGPAVRQYESGVEASHAEHVDPLRRHGLFVIALADLARFGPEGDDGAHKAERVLEQAIADNRSAFEAYRPTLDALSLVEAE